MAHIVVNTITFLFLYPLSLHCVFPDYSVPWTGNHLHYTYACNAFLLFFNNAPFSLERAAFGCNRVSFPLNSGYGTTLDLC